MSLLSQASLCVTPSAYKEGKLYSVIPSDGSGDLSVTRATTATRVNSAGLIELVPYNIVNYSEQFDNAAWTKVDASVTANTTTAPDGTLTADTITDNSTLDRHITYQSLDSERSLTRTLSTYAKQGTLRYLALSVTITSDSTACYSAIFDLQTGTITATKNNGSATISASIENAGNGWYRCIISGALGNGFETIYPVIATSDRAGFTGSLVNNNLPIYAGSGQSLYIWGAQLNEGTLLPYQKTETRLNIPRLDYSNGTCPSLLVEPQRTNKVTYSSSFDNAAWNKLNQGLGSAPIITPNYATAPDGTQTATRFQCNLNGGNTNASRSWMTLSFNPSLTINMSIYIKLNSAGSKTIVFSDSGGDTKVITNTEWQRIDLTQSGGSGEYRIGLIGGLSSDTLDCCIWGAQAEEGSYATSYIPTTSASVTRNADVISKTGISSLIGQTEGTMFWDINVDILSASGHEDIFNIDNGAFGNTIYLAKLSNATFGAEVYNASVQQFGVFSIPIPAVGRYKLALAYKTNDFAFYVNGVLVGSDTSGSVGAMSRIQLGQTVFGPSTGYTNAAALWQTRLTNDELATLTTI